MVAEQFPVELFIQPLPGFMILAGRAVAVAAGTEDNRRFFTLIATVDSNAASFGTACGDGFDNLPVRCRYFIMKSFQVFGAILSKDVSYCSHDPILS